MKPSFSQKAHDHDVKIGRMIGTIDIRLSLVQRLLILKQIKYPDKTAHQKTIELA